MTATTRHSTGTAAGAFEPVRAMMDRFLEAVPGYSSQLCVHHRGQVVVDLAGGDLRAESVTGVYSATKGVAALVVAHVLDTGALRLDVPVAHYWPEFAAEGKGSLTVGDVLAHQAGLPAVEGGVTIADLADSRGAAERLAAQAPWWRPGSAFGYHALTIGILMDELVHRVTQRTLHELYETDVRTPRDVDFYLGLPESEDHRYVPVADMAPTPEQLTEMRARPTDSLQRTVFGNTDVPDDRSPDGFSANNLAFRRGAPTAVGGVGSARGLARLYADALPGAATPIASSATLRAMAQQRSWGVDRVLGIPNCFGAAFMLPQPRMPFGEVGAFGHDGAGGALAFADPATGLAVGYVPAPMQYPGGADPRAVALARLAGEIAATE